MKNINSPGVFFYNNDVIRLADESRVLLEALAPGWFFIQVVGTLLFSNISFLQNEYKIYMNSSTCVGKGWFRHYLDERQLQFVKNYDLFRLYPVTIKFNRKFRTLGNDDKYIIYATEDWFPKSNNVKFTRSYKNTYIIHSLDSIKTLLDDNRVFDIDIAPRREVQNIKLGYLTNAKPEMDVVKDRFFVNRSLYHYGLSGEGEIVNVVDTGINHASCFFSDPNVSVPVNRTDFQHRKIVRIDAWVDSDDAHGGHGTHVCGMVAGKALCTGCLLNIYNGLAEDAKLFVTDIGNQNVLNDIGGDYDLDITSSTMLEIGSYISSNSWGFIEYEQIIIDQYDKASLDYPDITFIFSAGNYKWYNSMTIPANTKNVIAVGLVSNPVGFPNYNARVIYDQNGNSFELVELTKIYDPNGALISNAAVMSIDVQITDDILGKMQNKVTLMNNFNIESAQIAMNNGALCIITKDQDMNVTGIEIPVFSSANIDDVLRMQNVSIGFPYSKDHVSVSRVSSRGPGIRNILKPDVMGIGDPARSAGSLGPYAEKQADCSGSNVIEKHGTSMAAPSVAGLTALIHQFFHQGYYYNLTKGSSERLHPTSYLTKALLAASARNLGTIEPNIETGFGIPVGLDILPFEGGGLRVVDRKSISQSMHIVYNINITGNNRRLAIVLSYLDPPVPNSNKTQIFADVNLLVTTPDKKMIRGNQYAHGQFDKFSNIERVYIPPEEVSSGIYTVHIISGLFLLNETVNYSLVISGDFNHTDNVANPLFLEGNISDECPSSCGYGKCVNGVCVCDSYEAVGPLCDEPVNYESGEHTVKIPNRGTKTFLYNITSLRSRPFVFKSLNRPEPFKPTFCFAFGKYEPLTGDTTCFVQIEPQLQLIFTGRDYPELMEGGLLYMTAFVNSCKDEELILYAGTNVIYSKKHVTGAIVLVVLGFVLVMVVSCSLIILYANCRQESPRQLEYDEQERLSIEI